MTTTTNYMRVQLPGRIDEIVFFDDADSEATEDAVQRVRCMRKVAAVRMLTPNGRKLRQALPRVTLWRSCQQVEKAFGDLEIVGHSRRTEPLWEVA